MASNFPKLPGYVPTHDPTNVSHKKVSHIKLEQIRNARNVIVPLHALPRPLEKNYLPDKAEASMSLSHTQYPNHATENMNTLFEPTFVKLDKQVSTVQIVTLFDLLGLPPKKLVSSIFKIWEASTTLHF